MVHEVPAPSESAPGVLRSCLSVEAVARRVGVSPSTVRRALVRGDLAGFRTGTAACWASAHRGDAARVPSNDRALCSSTLLGLKSGRVEQRDDRGRDRNPFRHAIFYGSDANYRASGFPSPGRLIDADAGKKTVAEEAEAVSAALQRRAPRQAQSPISLVASGVVNCARCGLPIQKDQLWDLGHRDDGLGYSGPEHRHSRDCPAGGNRATARHAKERELVVEQHRPRSREW